MSQCHLIEDCFAWSYPLDGSGGLFRFSYLCLLVHSSLSLSLVLSARIRASSPCLDKVPKNQISDKKRDDGFQLTSSAEEDSEKSLLDLGWEYSKILRRDQAHFELFFGQASGSGD